MLVCPKCKEAKREEDIIRKYLHPYCKTCFDKNKIHLVRLTQISTKSPNVSVESVGLDWQLDSIRGRALEIMKKNDSALNSDEQLFLLYLEEYRNQLIIRKPTDNEISGLLVDLLMGEYHEGYRKESIDRVLEFIEKLKVNSSNLTSFQTLRLARQELKRESKRKGMLQLFDPAVEEIRAERGEIIKERYRREKEGEYLL